MKTNTIFENLLLSMYEKAINENEEVDAITKKITDLRDELEKIEGQTGKSAKTKRANINSEIDKLGKEKEEAKKNSEDTPDEEPEEDNSKEIEAQKKHISDLEDKIETTKEKAKDPKSPLNNPKVLQKALEPEEAKLSELKNKLADLEKTTKKPETKTGTEDETKTGTEGEEETKVEPEKKDDEGDSEMKEKNKEEIEKLDAQIKSLERTYDDKKESTTELINAAKETTDKLASSDMLKTLVSKTRLENKLKYQKKILSIVEDDKARKELSEIVKKEEATLTKLNTEIEDAQKKADEKGKDNPEYQEAKKAAKKEELANSTKDTEKRGNKDIDTSDIKDRDKDANIQYKLKIAQEKQKAISTAWQKKQDEVAETEDEDKKASLQKAADAIEKNLDAIKTRIENLENGIDEASDTEIWTIMAMINLVEQQIENFSNEFIPLNG